MILEKISAQEQVAALEFLRDIPVCSLKLSTSGKLILEEMQINQEMPKEIIQEPVVEEVVERDSKIESKRILLDDHEVKTMVDEVFVGTTPPPFEEAELQAEVTIEEETPGETQEVEEEVLVETPVEENAPTIEITNNIPVTNYDDPEDEILMGNAPAAEETPPLESTPPSEKPQKTEEVEHEPKLEIEVEGIKPTEPEPVMDENEPKPGELMELLIQSPEESSEEEGGKQEKIMDRLKKLAS